MLVYLLIVAALADNRTLCDREVYCESGSCCKGSDGWGCCPYPAGVCCPDSGCCPPLYYCQSSSCYYDPLGFLAKIHETSIAKKIQKDIDDTDLARY